MPQEMAVCSIILCIYLANYHRENEDDDDEVVEEPTLRRTVIDDATIEAASAILASNPRGILCAKDELSAWIRAQDQYKGGKGSDRQGWLSIWSSSSIIVDRKGKEPLMVPRPFVGLTGSIQPAIFSELRNDREDGLVDRFLVAYPDPVLSRWTDDEISEEASAAYQELYDRLYALQMATDENDEPLPERLEFTTEAKEVFVGEVNSLREEMECAGFPVHLKGAWSKLEAYLARISLILALVRIVQEESPFMAAFGSVIQADVESAAEVIAFFKGHAKRAYARLYGESPDARLTKALKHCLKAKDGVWEGQTSELFKILQSRGAPGLPNGAGAFGKSLRKVVQRENDLALNEVWRGNVQTIKLALTTAGTPGTPGKSGVAD